MLVFDCETNGLLHDVSEIHCIAIYDAEKKETFVFNNQPNNTYPITEGLHWLTHADTIVGHNIIGYDLPVLRKLILGLSLEYMLLILLCYLGVYHPNLMEIDKRRNVPRMPLQLYGRHSA